MNRPKRTLAIASVVVLVALSLSWAQGSRRGGGGGGGLSAEQLLGFMALSPDVLLTDEQLLNARNALRGSYGDQMNLRRSAQSGADPVKMQADIAALRKKMIAAANSVLTREQAARLKPAIERLGGGQRRGGGRR